MIKALFLIFLPRPTWEQIAAIQRKGSVVFLGYLLPLLLIVTFAEGYGLVRWGTPRGEVGDIWKFPVSHAVVYGVGQILLSIALVLIVAKLVKSLGETFHGRHSFRQVFTVSAYGLGPLFAIRVLNMFPHVSPWLTWAVGVALAIGVLYHGLPILLKPDPPHAFGLYFMSSLLLTIVTGLATFLTVWYLRGKLTKLDAVIAKIASQLPF